MPIPAPLLSFESWLAENAELLSSKAYEQADGPVFDFETYVLSEYENYCMNCTARHCTA